jgi:hypothetical protein
VSTGNSGGQESPTCHDKIRLFTEKNAINAVVLPQVAVSPKTLAPGGAVTVNGGGFTYPQRPHLPGSHQRHAAGDGKRRHPGHLYRRCRHPGVNDRRPAPHHRRRDGWQPCRDIDHGELT